MMASITLPPNNPVTQIFYFDIRTNKELTEDAPSSKIWSKAIDVLEKHPGFQRCYWGRSPEKPDRVQLHVGTSSEHSRPDRSFLVHTLSSSVDTQLSSHQCATRSNIAKASFHHPCTNTSSPPSKPLRNTTTPPLVRHAHLHAFTLPSPLTAPFPPFAGTAFYTRTTPTWHQGSWPLWTHIVRDIKGCVGIAGGSVEEDVDGQPDCYLVYVGWSSIEEHEAYHHTRHFEKRRVVLGLGNGGYREYGHIVFEGEREGGRGGMAKL